MPELYKYCVILSYSQDIDAFMRSVGSVCGTETFEETLLVLAFEKRFYEMETGVFAAADAIEYPNVCLLDGADNTAAAEFIKTKTLECGCEAVLFIDEGDTLDPHLLKYASYFFEDEDNRDRCGALFFPVGPGAPVPDEKRLPDGVCSLSGDGEQLPEKLKGAVILTSEMSAVGSFSRSAALYSAIRRNAFGWLNSARYYAAQDGDGYDAKTLCGAAQCAVAAHGGVPQYLAARINGYFASQMYLPLGEADAWLALLEPYFDPAQVAPPDTAENGSADNSASHEVGAETANAILPRVEIHSVQNYYADVQIKGVAHLADAETVFAAVPDTEPISASQEKIEDCYADIMYPKVSFTVVAKYGGGALTVRFLADGEPVAIVLCGEDPRNYDVAVQEDSLRITKIAPRAYYKVSVVIPAYNAEKYLRGAVDSVTSQTLDFFPNTQVVIVNDGSDDGTGEICRALAEKYIYNVTYVEQAHSGVSAARNNGLRRAMGKYLFFLDADDQLEPGVLEAGFKYLDKNTDINAAAFPIKYFDAGSATPVLNFRFDKNRVINTENDYDCIQFSACGVMFRAEAIEGLRFNEGLSYSEDAEFMHRVLLRDGRYAVIKEHKYLYRISADGTSAVQRGASDPDWYANFAGLWKLLTANSVETHGHITQYTQYLIVHGLFAAISEIEPPEGVDLRAVLAGIAESLQCVDDDLILSARTLPQILRQYLITQKYGGAAALGEDGGLCRVSIGAYSETFEPELEIGCIREVNGVLRVTGRYELPLYAGTALVAECGGKRCEAETFANDTGSLFFLGQRVREMRDFEFCIDGSEGAAAFYLDLGEGRVPMRLEHKNAEFFAGKSVIAFFGDAKNTLNIESMTQDKLAGAIKRFVGERAGAGELAAEYLRMYPFFASSRIWLFSDGEQSAGQTAALYRRCMDKRDGIDKYFVVGKDTIDSYELSEQGVSVIDSGSDMHKLLMLFAEKIIVSDPGLISYDGVIPELINGEFVYLPKNIIHCDGCSPPDAPHIPVTVCLSSETELAVLPERMRRHAIITGLLKHDDISDTGERRILYMPGYRAPLGKDSAGYDFQFKESEYCLKVSEFLCDERLMNAVEDYGYTFCFAPHETTYIQLADYDMDEIVEIIPPERSRTRLAESCALLVTDNMPEFDFAYLRKPVVYYRFTDSAAGTPPRFGDAQTGLDAAVDLLIKYMENGCAADSEYLSRVDGFFAFGDGGASARVYDALK